MISKDLIINLSSYHRWLWLIGNQHSLSHCWDFFWNSWVDICEYQKLFFPSVTDSSKVISSRVLSPVHMCAALSVNLLLCGMSSSLWLIGGSLLRMFIWCWGHGGLRIQWLGTVATRWLSRCYWRIMMFSSVIYV